MTRPSLFAGIDDPDSDMVKDALARRCEVCKAKPGDDCHNAANRGVGMIGRLVHYTRTTP